MSNYRRSTLKGGTFFFTVVTFRRRKILARAESREILRVVVCDVKNRWPFTVESWVLLPDHLHAIWTLPEGDRDYSKRWGLIKAGFSNKARALFHRESWVTDSKRKHRESTLWQRRFWEHQIRDDQDFRTHMDYIHYNPVKHGLVERVADWPYSTFHRYVRNGVYPPDWGGGAVTAITKGFGE